MILHGYTVHNPRPGELRMKKLIAAGRYGLGFHGSATNVEAFLDSRVGLGGDSNSALGLFMSHVPLNALEYALNANELGEGEEVNVYVVAYPTQGKEHVLTPSEYYGFDENEKPAGREHFQDLRKTLLQAGYDHITCDTGEDAVTIALRPSLCRIVAVLTEDQVNELEERLMHSMDALKVYEALEPLLPKPSPLHVDCSPEP